MSTPRPYIDHLGIIVSDLARATERFRLIFGCEPGYSKEMPEVGLKIAAFEAENITLELIEYAAGGSDHGKQVMGEEVGINHLSIGVDDLGHAIQKMTAAGLVLQDGFPTEGADGQVAFFKRDKDSGVLFELCQKT